MRDLKTNKETNLCRRFQEEGIALALVEHELPAEDENFWLSHVEHCEDCLACVADLLYADSKMKSLAIALHASEKQVEESPDEIMSLDSLEIESNLHEDLFDFDGELLLARGTRLTPAIIGILRSRGIEKIKFRKAEAETPAIVEETESADNLNGFGKPGIEKISESGNQTDRSPNRRIEYLDDDEETPLDTGDFREGFFFAGETSLEPRFKKQAYIKLIEKITPSEAISQDTKVRAISTIENSLARVHDGEAIEIKAIREITNEVINQLLENENKTLSLADLFLFSSKLYTHSFNTLVIFTVCAKSINISRENIISAGEAVLLHDIGRVVQHKAEKDDKDYYRNHPMRGYRHLMKMGGLNEKMLSLVLNHHERFDGKGFPRGIAADKLSILDQLLIVSNTYDKAVTDPVHKVKRDFHSAAQIIYQSPNKLVSADITNVFLNVFGIYPPGTYVRLKSGEEGLIKEANYARPFQPIVTLIKDRNGSNLPESLEIDLRELEHSSIERSIDIAPLLEN
jgi:HD-GYP domain-containing protein (c-di-GMP phosphodiesterase class II)